MKDLEAKRDELALAVREGRADERELRAVEQDLATLQDAEGLAADRAAAAKRARDRREQAQADQAARQRRRALQDELACLATERGALAEDLEVALVSVRAVIGDLIATGRRMYEVSAQLNCPYRRFQLENLVEARLATVLYPHAGARPDASLRRPLPEMLPTPPGDGATPT
jgi:hypothetical protein